jgi:hypothetical protein
MKSLENIKRIQISVDVGFSVVSQNSVWLDSTHIATVVGAYNYSNDYHKSYLNTYEVTTTNGIFAITLISSNAYEELSNTHNFSGHEILMVDPGKLVVVSNKSLSVSEHYLYVHTFTYDVNTFSSITQRTTTDIVSISNSSDISIDFFVGVAGFWIVMIAYDDGYNQYLSTISTNIVSSTGLSENHTVTVDNAKSSKLIHVSDYSFLLIYAAQLNNNPFYVKVQVINCNSFGVNILEVGSGSYFNIAPLVYDFLPHEISMAETTSINKYMASVGVISSGQSDTRTLAKTFTVNVGTGSITWDNNTTDLGYYYNTKLSRISDTSYVMSCSNTLTAINNYHAILVELDGTTITPEIQSVPYNTGISGDANYYIQPIVGEDYLLFSYGSYISIIGPIVPKINVGGFWRRVRNIKIKVGSNWEETVDTVMKVKVGSVWKDIYH